MCYDWRQDYNDYLNRIIEKKTEMYQLLSKKDLEQQDILHFIENEKCSAAKMSKLIKKLKEVRHERREIKNEIDALMEVHCRIGGKELVSKNITTYKYRTNIVQEVIGK